MPPPLVQVKYDETMIRLEEATASVVKMFTEVEARREALVTKDFLAWQKAQHEHFPRLLTAISAVPAHPPHEGPLSRTLLLPQQASHTALPVRA